MTEVSTMSSKEYIASLMANVKAKNPAEPEFHQAVKEVLESLRPAIDRNPKYKEFMDQSGLGMVWKSAAEFDKYMAEEDASNQKIMKASGMIN